MTNTSVSPFTPLEIGKLYAPGVIPLEKAISLMVKAMPQLKLNEKPLPTKENLHGYKNLNVAYAYHYIDNDPYKCLYEHSRAYNRDKAAELCRSESYKQSRENYRKQFNVGASKPEKQIPNSWGEEVSSLLVKLMELPNQERIAFVEKALALVE